MRFSLFIFIFVSVVCISFEGYSKAADVRLKVAWILNDQYCNNRGPR